MDEQLRDAIERLLKDGSPDTLVERLTQLLGPCRQDCAEEYAHARTAGLSISESQLSVLISDCLELFGLEGFLHRLEQVAPHPVKVKRKRRKHEAEPAKRSKK